MKIHLKDIGEGKDLRFHLDRAQVDELFAVTGGELVGTDAGLSLNGRVQLLDDTVIVSGALSAEIGFVCVRCAELRSRRLELPLDAVLMPRSSTDELDSDLELTAEDMDVSFYDGEEIELDPLVRETIFLEFPAFPACEAGSEACEQALEAIKAALDTGEEEVVDGPDPRWAALGAIREKLRNGSS